MRNISVFNVLKIALFVIAFVGGFSKIALADVGQPLDEVVAVVNTEVITASQLNKQIEIAKQQLMAANSPIPAAAVLRQQVLNQLIDNTLQLQVAKKANVIVDDQQVDGAIAQIASKNNLSVTQLQAKIAQQGMNYQDYREEIHKEMIISQLQQREIGPSVTVSDQEVADMMYTLKTKPQLLQPSPATTTGTQYHLIDILIPLADDADADTVRRAQQHAQDLVNKLQNTNISPLITLGNDSTIQVADLGWRTQSQLPDIFDKVITNLSSGQFSSPFRAPNGIHIIQLVAINGPANNAMALNSGLNQSVPQAEIQSILIKKNPLLSDQQMQARLQLLRSQIIESGDFAHVAELNSQDANSASKGGDLGWVNPGTLPPQVDEAVSQLKLNELSQPIETPAGYYIIKVTAKRQLYNQSNALQERARQLVYQRKYAEALQSWLRKLRSQSYVKVTD